VSKTDVRRLKCRGCKKSLTATAKDNGDPLIKSRMLRIRDNQVMAVCKYCKTENHLGAISNPQDSGFGLVLIKKI